MQVESIQKKSLRITCISDMHGEYNRLNLPGGDLLICAGDFLYSGDNYQPTLEEGLQFIKWLNDQHYLTKIFVAGNHDLVFEKNEAQIRQTLKQYPSIRYLLNETTKIEIDGIKLQIFGSPLYVYHQSRIIQSFTNNDSSRSRIFNNIPENTDILITHGPSYGKCDENYKGISCGCPILKQVINKINPKLHVFGHIHEANGTSFNGNTHFINAAIMSVGFSRDYSRVSIHHTSFTWTPNNNKLE
ncbi:Calcineurin-like_phosphoesterase [Hexamita inflata]|uniref:Calcineurin-like phosphoesterase n=1 Tax=Hexamita inflata TaxID=28002 RepID=A0AA86TE34_9EUKA|nr:Calcineurin-like phosphoesterase [Hexamita inflata]CAI9915205.1 Calcineurin-like phosphoesterase [Hexamita inflata]CAI9977090.1 Calcineurin-like phosphoesterase [Hexamita inflata]